MRTFRSRSCVLITAFALSASINAQAGTRSAVELFLPGSYGAVLQVRAQTGQLLDDDGAITRLEYRGCGSPVELPAGLWLLTRDDTGLRKLIAPSATPLPAGHRGEVALAACGEPAAADTLHLPAALIAALEAHASSILIQR